MIQANELRIGNWLQSKIPFQVTGENIEQFSRGVNHPTQLISPIPLTPEILKKCGFEENLGGWYLDGDIDQKSFRSDDRKFAWCMTLSHVDDNDVHFRVGYSSVLINDAPARHIQYLHQLQNLYYSLTGKELTINI